MHHLRLRPFCNLLADRLIGPTMAFLQPSGRSSHLTNFGLFTTFWPDKSFDQLWPFYNLLAEQII
jgi:hypothetical protein